MSTSSRIIAALVGTCVAVALAPAAAFAGGTDPDPSGGGSLPLPGGILSPTPSTPSPSPSATKKHKKPKKKKSKAAIAQQVTFTIATPRVRSLPNGQPATLSGKTATSLGTPAAKVSMAVERQINGGAWQSIGTTVSDDNGAWTFVVRAWSPLLIHYRLRVTPDSNWQESVSPEITHESRNDPLDYAQVHNFLVAAQKSGISVSIGFVDRSNGRTYSYSTAAGAYYAASVTKVAFAMDVLAKDSDAGLTAPTADQVSKLRPMIRISDNNAAATYWNANGQSAIYGRLNKRCGTSLPTSKPLSWGRSQLPPLQVASLLDCLADNRAMNASLSDWLINEMRSVTASQRWGIPAANPDPYRVEANKNGWSSWTGVSFRTVNSTALFGPDGRYALVLFTQYPASVPQSKGEATIKSLTQTLFPYGTIVY